MHGQQCNSGHSGQALGMPAELKEPSQDEEGGQEDSVQDVSDGVMQVCEGA